jgi:hypothetical protein
MTLVALLLRVVFTPTPSKETRLLRIQMSLLGLAGLDRRDLVWIVLYPVVFIATTGLWMFMPPSLDIRQTCRTGLQALILLAFVELRFGTSADLRTRGRRSVVDQTERGLRMSLVRDRERASRSCEG